MARRMHTSQAASARPKATPPAEHTRYRPLTPRSECPHCFSPNATRRFTIGVMSAYTCNNCKRNFGKLGG